MSLIIKGYVTGQPFFESGSYKMYGFIPNDEYLGKVVLSDYGNVTIKGELPTLIEGKEYEIEVEYEKKGKYESYIVKRFVNNPMDMNKNQAFSFLSEIIGANLAKNILNIYPEFIQMVIQNKKNDIDVLKIKGVKEKSLNRIIEKINQNIMFFNIINEFKEYELTLTQIQKIYKMYSSFELLKQKMNENPYRCLCSIGGIGFKTADTKIINKDRSLITSKYRMIECVLHILNENEKNNCHTWIKTSELYSKCSNLTPQCMEQFEQVLETNDLIYYDKINKRVAKKQTYFAEKEIAERLLSIASDPKALNIDYTKYNKTDEFELTKEQMLSMKYACKYLSLIHI